MQDLKIATEVTKEELTGRTVTLFFHPNFIELSGCWHWDLSSDAVFCSDVILALPSDFAGTRGIIHPDDVDGVKCWLQDRNNLHLEFRIITTYGEVKNITGENVTVGEIRARPDEVRQYLQAAAAGKALWKKELEQLQLFKEVHEKADRYFNTGIWWYNEMTNETWYSAEVFRIFGLPPNSLNAHLNTFNSFIHPEDRETVEEFLDRAYREKTPLHIEYRIQTATAEKQLLHITQWFINEWGAPILSGILQDITGQKCQEAYLDEIENNALLFRQQLMFNEQNLYVGHWQVNLVTRKTTYSENFFRLFGIRTKPVTETGSTLLDYIHPEDQERYRQAHRKMLHEHLPPDIEFRIYRRDGKIRYFTQEARLVSYGNDLVMIGIIQDVTVRKQLEIKVKELTEAANVKAFVQSHYEEMAGLSGWIWNLHEGTIQGSENFFKMLGLKPGSVELTQKRIVSFVHPEDQKMFTEQVTLTLMQKMESRFRFRFLQLGKTRHIQCSFSMMENGGEEFFIATLVDITSEYQLKQELKERVQLAEALSENIKDCVFITDTSHNILVWNRPCEEAYKLKKEEVLGKNIFDIFPRLKTPQEMSVLSRVLSGESLFLQATSAFAGRGHYDLHLLPLWNDENAEVAGIVHMIHDVTKETDLRQALNERLSFIENLVESSVDRIIAMDHNLNYLVWNKKCEEYYGLKKEEVLGRNVLEVFPDAQHTPSYEHFRRVLKGETIYIPAVTEEDNYHEVYLIPVKNDKGEIVAILWILHDLRKELEAERTIRQQSQLMETVFEASLDSILLLRAIRDEKSSIMDFEVVLNNRTSRKWNGRDLSGLRYAETFPVVINNGILDGYRKVLDMGEPMNTELYYEGSGSGRWFRITAVRLNQDELVATAEDITGRKLAEAELSASRELIEEITDTIPDLITIHDAANHVIYSNHDELWKRLLNVPEIFEREETQRVDHMIHPDDIEKAKRFQKDRMLLKDDQVKEVELKIKTGQWIRVRSKVFRRDEKGEVAQIISFTTDITESKRAEEELKKHLTILQHTEEMARTGSWEYEFATGAFHWSEGMYRLFGLPLQVIVHPEIYSEVAVEEDRQVAKRIISALKKKPMGVEETLRIRVNETVKTLRIKGTLVYDEKGTAQKIIGVDVDVTDIQLSAENLKESQPWL